MKKRLVIWLAVMLAAGSLSGCSWWKSSESEENVETMEESAGTSGEKGQQKIQESGQELEETAEQTAEETEETAEVVLPVYPWEELTLLKEQAMTFVEAGEESAGYYVFRSEDEGIELSLTPGATGSGAYLSINGDEYLFLGNDSSYSVSEAAVPQVVLYDINGDEVQDVIVWVAYSTEAGTAVEQNTYLSGKKEYTALGSVTWDINEKEHAFAYSIELCDDYLVRVTLPDYGIDSWVEMDVSFAEQAKTLGLYDSDGQVTVYAGEWETDAYQAPVEERIECGLNADGEFVIRVYAPVSSGYSAYSLGVTLVEDYKVTDDACELSDVNILEDEIYDMVTVNGSAFRVRDNVRGKSVHLVRVTEDGEKEILTIGVSYGTVEPEDVTLEAVEDLMGYPAFYVDKYEAGRDYHMNYYYGVTDSTVVELGAGFGGDPSECNFILDVDDDGETELICNTTGSNGWKRCSIYFQEDGRVYQGDFTVLDEEAELVSGSTGYPSIVYLSDENLLEVTYLVKGENGETELKTQKYEATIDNLKAEYIYNYPSTK